MWVLTPLGAGLSSRMRSRGVNGRHGRHAQKCSGTKCAMQGMRYWVLQPLVVRKGLAAPAASSSSAASSCSSGGGTSYSGSPAQSFSPMQSPGGTTSPPKLSSPRTGPPLTKGVARRPVAVSPMARVAHSLRRLVGSRKADLEVSLIPAPAAGAAWPAASPSHA